MNYLGTKKEDSEYKNKISNIIQGKSSDLHGVNGYKPIMQTMTKIPGKQKKKSLQILIYFQSYQRGF